MSITLFTKSTYEVLEVLYRNPNPMNVTSIAQNIDSSYHHMSERTRILEKHGVIELAESHDGRSKLYHITDKGISVFEKLESAKKEWEDEK